MLSFYDALTFSVQKKSLFCSICFATFILLCLFFTGFSLETNFSVFSAFRTWLTAAPQSIPAANALYAIAEALGNPLFWGLLFQKVLWVSFLFFFFTLVFFAFELIISKKVLFNQPPRFSTSFFMVTLGKFLLLISPVLLMLYFYLHDVLKSALGFAAGLVMGVPSTYVYPFSTTGSLIVGILTLTYLLYTLSLFIERFSFASLLQSVPFLKHIKTVGELILWAASAKIMLFISWAVLFVIGWQIHSLWVCFAALMAYLIWMMTLTSARFIFILPFILMGIVALFIQAVMGRVFFQQYLFTYMIGTLVFYCFFLFWFMFWAALAHLFAQTAFVFRFNQTPASDIKQKSPHKLHRLDELYNTYLQEHHNDTQDNFFNHLEEKRK